MVEPWLRGTLTEVEPIRRQVLHALQLAEEDAERWCAGLSTEAIHLQPFGMASVAFHLRHISRSLDRLMTYAEGRHLSESQREKLGSEGQPEGDAAAVMAEFRHSLASAKERVLAAAPERFAEVREVGRQRLKTTCGGLLIHCAEHTQRHIGQAITTAKVVAALLNDANVRGVRAV